MRPAIDVLHTWVFIPNLLLLLLLSFSLSVWGFSLHFIRFVFVAPFNYFSSVLLCVFYSFSTCFICSNGSLVYLNRPNEEMCFFLSIANKTKPNKTIAKKEEEKAVHVIIIVYYITEQLTETKKNANKLRKTHSLFTLYWVVDVLNAIEKKGAYLNSHKHRQMLNLR